MIRKTHGPDNNKPEPAVRFVYIPTATAVVGGIAIDGTLPKPGPEPSSQPVLQRHPFKW
jgi:hypothetical protein